MSRDAKIVLDWADGTFPFRLGWGEIAELQEKVDAGPYMVLHRLHSHEWRIEHISNVIRLGLIGGGMDPVSALKKVRTYVEARVPLENHAFAVAILSAGLLGAPDERVGETEAPSPDQLMTSPTGNSDLAPSTEPEPY